MIRKSKLKGKRNLDFLVGADRSQGNASAASKIYAAVWMSTRYPYLAKTFIDAAKKNPTPQHGDE